MVSMFDVNAMLAAANAARGYTWDDVVAALGTEALMFLDFDSTIKPLTRAMAETRQWGEDWLVCVNLAQVAGPVCASVGADNGAADEGDRA